VKKKKSLQKLNQKSNIQTLACKRTLHKCVEIIQKRRKEETLINTTTKKEKGVLISSVASWVTGVLTKKSKNRSSQLPVAILTCDEEKCPLKGKEQGD